jgi:hypothetical protein
MLRIWVAWAFPLMFGMTLLGLASCKTAQPGPESASTPDIHPTLLDYVDGDGFDALFETALVNQDPVIIVRTGRQKPDWDGRLNAWIAAWNRSEHKAGRRAAADGEPVVRGQAPVPKVTVDGESIREFRLLVSGLLDRIDDAAQSGAAWWAEERARSRRVSLLKPYSLRFHMGEDDLIQLVFFHGGYAGYYSRHMQLLMRSNDMAESKWSRSLECSGCPKKWDRDRIDRVTSRGEDR